MKKLTVALALILCLVLCVFAFASCKKKNSKTGTTADVSVPAGTTAVPDATTGERVTSAPHVHVPGDWEIITAPTCTTEGEKVKYCEECGALIEGSEAIIPSVPDAHVVDDWNIVEPTLLDPVGSKTGVCKYCKKDLDYVLNWEINPYSSVEKTGKYADNNDFRFHKSIADIRGEDHFYPTDENPDGNDLWFEYSLLWNKTLYNRDTPKNLSEIRLFGFRESTSWSNYRGFYYLYLLNDDSQGGAFHTSNDCPFQGHIDYSTYDVDHPKNHEHECAYDLSELGNTLNGRLIGRYKAGWDPKRTESPYLWDSEYQTMGGWHRLGFRYHQEAAIVEGAVVYSGYTELYIDGVLCWKIDSNFKPGHQDSLVTKNLLLWTATPDEEDPTKLNYTDHDSMMVEMRLDSVGNSSKEVLVAVDDVQWTCGTGFVTPVVRVENPKPVTIELAEGIEDDGAMYYAKPGCVHEAEAEWTVTEEPTLLEAGAKAKYCAKCGERMETAVAEYEPVIKTWTDASEGEFDYGKKNIVNEVLSGDHFYPTEDNATGKDLLVEYSILWNESMLNFLGGGANPWIHTFVGSDTVAKGNNIAYWSPVADNNNADCKFAGGFEYGTMRTSEAGNPYPQMTKPVGDSIDEFPNIGGNNGGDGTPQGDPQWGWHRVQIRLHIDVTNAEALKADTTAGATAATYKCTTTIKIDGVLVSILSSDAMTDKNNSYDNKLFTAASDGQGGIVYTDIAEDKWIHPIRFNSTKAKDGTTIYVVIGDVSAICGTKFVQDVEKVATPESATLEVAPGVNVSAAMYYKAKTE